MSRSQKKTILLVDDHALVRSGMRALINLESDLVVVAEADSVASALEILSEPIDIHVVLLDLSINENIDFDGIRQIKSIRPGIPVLIVSMCNEKTHAELALASGADGYVMKQETGDVMTGAIRCVINGDIFLSSSMQEFRLAQKERRSLDGDPITKLSKAEIDVMQMIAAGLSNAEIALSKNRSVKTIEVHRANIRLKLDLKDGAEVTRYAILKFPPLPY